MPERIQRKREPLWRKPEDAVYVGRGRYGVGKWGNPYVIGAPGVPDAETAVELYRQLIVTTPEFLASVRRELAGRPLMCWCPEDRPCHGDVLLEIANQPIPENTP